jgi:hypothetical protein
MLVSEVPTPAGHGLAPARFVTYVLPQNGVLITGSLVGDKMNTRGLRAHHHTTFYKIQVSKGLTDSSCHF